jgi:hypothetical protein
VDSERIYADTYLHVVMKPDPNRFVKPIWAINGKTIRLASARTEGSDFNFWD